MALTLAVALILLVIKVPYINADGLCLTQMGMMSPIKGVCSGKGSRSDKGMGEGEGKGKSKGEGEDEGKGKGKNGNGDEGEDKREFSEGTPRYHALIPSRLPRYQ